MMTKPLLAILLLLLLASQQARSFFVEDTDEVTTLRANLTSSPTGESEL